MVELLELASGTARLLVAPAMGGGIARLDVNEAPVLRPFKGDEKAPFSLASNILVPFSNRISGGGFSWNGRFHRLSPNLPGEAFPIHGDGFLKPWQPSYTENGLALALADGAIGPWRYSARQSFQLSQNRLSVSLEVTNEGDFALPFGGGFHPWFPRSQSTRLFFEADSVWLEDDRNLPIKSIPLKDNPKWRFYQARPLPTTWINNGYSKWSRLARIEQGEDAVSCTLTASANLTDALVYSPGETSDFFCFEPVSHPVDAINLPGAPGLCELSSGERLEMSFMLEWNFP